MRCLLALGLGLLLTQPLTWASCRTDSSAECVVYDEQGCVLDEYADDLYILGSGQPVCSAQVEFLMLREGICRVGTIFRAEGADRVVNVREIRCPVEELQTYLPGQEATP